MKRLISWLDERTGFRALLRWGLSEPIPGGAKLAYVFGSGLAFVFLSQVVTGVALALYYCPSPEHAHTSVSYIMKEVASGALLRSVHAYGASAMVILLIFHVVQVFLYGAYKGRRELLWMTGALLGLLVLAMGFTGYLLPWDQKAYFATTVGTNIASEVPFIGDALRRIMRGGNEVGGLTLSRFFVLHVFILPGLIFCLVALHIFLFRKAGPAGPTAEDPFDRKLSTEPFFPRQFVYDLLCVLLLVAALFTAATLSPVELGPIADPSDTQYLPRPEWYYRPLFQWYRYWNGPGAVIGVVVIPMVVALLFLLVPFLDRGSKRYLRARKAPIFCFAFILTALFALGARSYYEDEKDPGVADQLARQEAAAKAYLKAPFEPVISGSHLDAAAPAKADPHPGKALYEKQACNICHGERGEGSAAAPKLTGLAARYKKEELAKLLQVPTDRMQKGGMQPVPLPPEELAFLVEYLRALK